MRTPTQYAIALIISLLLAPLAQAEQADNTTKLPAKAATCPSTENIQKDQKTMTWRTSNGWRSYDKSFSKRITHFLGAQWQGVNVGNVVCLYQSDDDMTFPITLHFNALVEEPTDGAWSKNLGGYKNCKSDKQESCYFIPHTTKQQGGIEQQAKAIKAGSGGEQEQGF